MDKDPCWKGYEMIGTKKKNGKEVPNCVPKEEACCDDCAEPLEEEAEYEGRKVTLNKPFGGDSKHKRYVYVKNDKGNIIKLGFGDPNMEIKRDDPERRKAYRARHNCDNPGPKWKANYWSCKYWSATPTSKLDEKYSFNSYLEGFASSVARVTLSTKDKARVMNVVSDLSDIPGNWDHKGMKFSAKGEAELKKALKNNKSEIAYAMSLDYSDFEESVSTVKESISIPLYVQEAAYEGNIGMMELAKFYMKANENEKKKLQDLIKKQMFKDAWKLVQDKTGVKLVGKEFHEAFSDAQIKKLKSEYSKVNTIDPSSDTYKKLTAMLDKMDKSTLTKLAGAQIKFVSGLAQNRVRRMKEDVAEEVAANSVAGGGVDMNPTGKPKWDKRSKFHIDHMFRRADGTKYGKKKELNEKD